MNQQPSAPSPGSSDRDNDQHAFCQNCKTRLQPDWTYCPGCGQDRHSLRYSLGRILLEFFGDLFAFESRIWKTLGTFLFKPGVMTRDYLQGKRARYVNPGRVLLFGCLLMFALTAQLIKRQDWVQNPRAFNFPININIEDDDQDSLGLLKTDSVGMPESAPGNDAQSGLESQNGHVSEVRGADVESDSALHSTIIVGATPHQQQRYQKLKKTFLLIPALADSLSPNQVAEELVPTASYWRKKVIVQSTKVYQSRGTGLISFMIGNGTLVVLLSVFLQALLLRLLYIRRPFYLVEHAIHATHGHAALIYLTSILLILQLSGLPFYTVAYNLMIPYLLLSMYRVYQQSKTKTFIKFTIISFLYISVYVPVLLLFSLIVSFLFF